MIKLLTTVWPVPRYLPGPRRTPDREEELRPLNLRTLRLGTGPELRCVRGGEGPCPTGLAGDLGSAV